jgi:cell division protein FtsB
MQIEVELVIEAYKEELARLINENIVLKAQLKQLQNNQEDTTNGDDE